MFTDTNNLKGLSVRATDGEIGTVDELYFDDQTWALRYLVVDTGSWLSGRKVLISPRSIVGPDWQTKKFDLNLTKAQIENSPDIDTEKPVSRQHEEQYYRYYGFPSYWSGPSMWGQTEYPLGVSVPVLTPADPSDTVSLESGDSHLRSTEEVTGYAIEAVDGEIGHLDKFIFDSETWAIRYIEVATRNWWPGKKVLLSPAWVKQVSWPESKVSVSVTRTAIQEAPEYDDSTVINREYEDRLYSHYGLKPYWENLANRESEYTAVVGRS